MVDSEGGVGRPQAHSKSAVRGIARSARRCAGRVPSDVRRPARPRGDRACAARARQPRTCTLTEAFGLESCRMFDAPHRARGARVARRPGFAGAGWSGKLEKLPRSGAREKAGRIRVHPILENSTACTMSNAKNLVPSSDGRRFLWKTFKQQSKSVMICSVSFKLAEMSAYSGGSRRIDVPPACWLCNQTFTESLILAQDERWRRA